MVWRPTFEEGYRHVAMKR